jgi:hypothetical protein
MFRPLLADGLMQAARHVTVSQQVFTFTVGSESMNSMLVTLAAQNTNVTALQLILSKMLNPCLIMSLSIQGTCSFLL